MIPVLRYAAIGSGPAPRDRPWTVRPDVFADHLRAIVAAGRVPISASSLGDMVRTGTVVPDAVVITFDGGSTTFREAALRARDSGLATTLFVPTGWLSRPGRLERRELRLLAKAGVEIGGAGHTYRRFNELGPADQRAEAQRARNDLADILGREPTAFAYPYGAHDATARAAVRAAGYTCAFATGERAARPEDDVLAISRLTVRAVTSTRTLVSWLTTDQPPAPERGRARPARGALYAATTRLVRRPWTTLAGRGGSPVGPGIPADREAMSVRRSTLGSRPNQSHVPTQAQAVRPGSTPGGLGCGRPVVTLELPDQIPPRSTSASDRSRSADHDGPIRP